MTHLKTTGLSAGRKTTNHGLSVPGATWRENPGPESLRPKKQKLSVVDVEDMSPSLRRTMITRGRKRDLSPHATVSQTNVMAITSVSATELIAGDGDQHLRKRRKRSLSTPAAARSSQLSTQLQLRRPRSRAGSPTTEAEYVPPSRASARLVRRIPPFVNSHSSDIYAHLADPDGTKDLLSQPPVGSIVLSTPNETVGSQSGRKPRGRRRKVVNLGNENARGDLMEEWAQLRQLQGTIPFSGIDKHAACLSQTFLCETRKGNNSPSQRETLIAGEKSTDSGHLESQMMATTGTSQYQGRISPGSLTRMDLEHFASAGTDALGDKVDHRGSVPPPDVETERPMVPNLRIDVEGPSTPVPDLGADEDSPDDETGGVLEIPSRGGMHQRPESSPPRLSASSSREDTVRIKYVLPVNEPAELPSLDDPPKDSQSATLPHTYSLDNSGIHFNSDQEFYMLDIPDIFTLPWVPVTSHLYLPSGLGKLVSGMREQLSQVARARRRAEELYHAELGRRISAERTIEDLRIELEKQKGPSASLSG